MKKGFSTLFIVIILGGISLNLILAFSTSSLWSVRSSSLSKTSGQARSLVNACAEFALETLRENNNYLGTNSLMLNGNTCTYTVSDNGGINRSIMVMGTVGVIVRRLSVTIAASNPLVVSSWQELP